MSDIVKQLIGKYKDDFNTIGQENYRNIIGAAAEKGFAYILEFREVLITTDINVKVFDQQLSEMLVNYTKILELTK